MGLVRSDSVFEVRVELRKVAVWLLRWALEAARPWDAVSAATARAQHKADLLCVKGNVGQAGEKGWFEPDVSFDSTGLDEGNLRFA